MSTQILNFLSRIWKGTTFVGLLMFMLQVNCIDGQVEMINKNRLEHIKVYDSTSALLCIRPSNEGSQEVQLVVSLSVEGTYTSKIFPAGSTTINDLKPKVWHSINIKHAEENGVVHILNVEVDGKAFVFNKVDKSMWVNVYKFKEITILAKGILEISDCPPPADPTTTTTTTTIPTTTTPTTTTTTPTTTTTTTPTTTTTTKTTTTTPTTTTTDVSAPTTTTLMTNETLDSSDSEPWYEFVYVLGEVNSFPTLLIVIIAVVGVSIVICIIACLCKRGCCCTSNDGNVTERDNSYRYSSIPSSKRIEHTDFYANNIPFTPMPIDNTHSPRGQDSGSLSPEVVVSKIYSCPYEMQNKVQRQRSQGNLQLGYDAQGTVPRNTSMLPMNQSTYESPRNEYPAYIETFFT